MIEKFYLNCVEEGVMTRRTSSVESAQLVFYLVELQETLEVNSVVLKNVASNFYFALSVYYLVNEDEEEKREKMVPKRRSLLLR